MPEMTKPMVKYWSGWATGVSSSVGEGRSGWKSCQGCLCCIFINLESAFNLWELLGLFLFSLQLFSSLVVCLMFDKSNLHCKLVKSVAWRARSWTMPFFSCFNVSTSWFKIGNTAPYTYGLSLTYIYTFICTVQHYQTFAYIEILYLPFALWNLDSELSWVVERFIVLL